MSNDSKVVPKTTVFSVGLNDQDEAGNSSQKTIITDSSWGDRWKKAAFNSTTYFGINYVVNTLLSVAVAYVIESKCDTAFRAGGGFIGKHIAAFTKGDAGKIGNSVYMGTKALSLTMGGTMLVPVLKLAEDHRHGLEFRAGHAFDLVQDKLGLGNEATAENLREYATLKAAVKSGKAPDASQDDLNRFTTQHCIGKTQDGKFGFIEQKISWPKVITARAAAWGVAFVTNASLERLFGLEAKLKSGAPGLTKTLAKTFPSLLKLKDPDKVSANLVNDSILCVSSAVTTPVVMRALKRDKHVLKHVQFSDPTECGTLPCPPQAQPQPSELPPEAAASRRQWVKEPQGAEAHVARAQRKAANDEAAVQRA